MLNIDLNNAPEALKSSLVNLVVLPFWYIAIYLFNPDFFIKNDFSLILAFCFCFTVIGSILLAFYTFYLTEKKHDFFDLHAAIGTALAQVTVHSFLIVVFYVMKQFLESDYFFHIYLVTYFFGLIWRAVKTHFKNKN